MRLFLILLTVISFGAFGSVSNVMLDGSIANTGIETIRGSSVPIGRNKVMLPSDMENLLLNSSFEAQNATQDWTVTSLATATASTSDVFDGKKKVCLSGIGSIFQMLSDTDKYHGRKFIARFNIQNPQGREGRACIYDGEDLHKCVQIQKSDDFVEYVTGDTFIKGKSYGVIVNSLELDDICVDAVSVKLDANEAYVAEIEGKWQQVILKPTSGFLRTTNLSTLPKIREEGNHSLISLSSEGVAVTEDQVELTISASSFNSNSTIIGLDVFLNNTVVGASSSRSTTNSPNGSSFTLSLVLNRGDRVTLESGGNTGGTISILAKARSQVINYPDETFSTDVNPVYWKATECGGNEIGCYNTYSYAANTNTKTLCTSRPTQSDADMRVNGIRIYTRSYTDPSTCVKPARIEVVLPKGLSAPTLSLYKDTTREIMASLDVTNNTNNARIGVLHKNYNPKTGRFIFDGADTWSTTFTGGAFLRFEDQTSADNGYLVIKASKTGAVLANKPPRELVKVVQHPGNTGETKIYSDGYIEMVQFIGTSSGTGTRNFTFYVPFRDTNYFISRNVVSGSGGAAATIGELSAFAATTTGFSFVVSEVGRNGTNTYRAEGYGAASYLWDNYGIKVNY